MPDTLVRDKDKAGAGWLSFERRFDDGPAAKAAIGLVALATDMVIEPELYAFLPRDGAAVYSSRIPVADKASVRNLLDMELHLADAARLILPEDKLHVMAFGCTSGSMAIGPDKVAARVNSVRPGIPVTNPVSASLKGLRAMGARRIALLTPYPAEINAVVETYVSGQGFDIVAKGSFGCGADSEIVRLKPEAIYEAGVELGRAKVDALFLSCTGLRVSSILERLEGAIGKPVVASNQALAWDCLRLAGDRRSVEGFGRLLQI